jgi:hypothetical protein
MQKFTKCCTLLFGVFIKLLPCMLFFATLYRVTYSHGHICIRFCVRINFTQSRSVHTENIASLCRASL